MLTVILGLVERMQICCQELRCWVVNFCAGRERDDVKFDGTWSLSYEGNEIGRCCRVSIKAFLQITINKTKTQIKLEKFDNSVKQIPGIRLLCWIAHQSLFYAEKSKSIWKTKSREVWQPCRKSKFWNNFLLTYEVGRLLVYAGKSIWNFFF